MEMAAWAPRSCIYGALNTRAARTCACTCVLSFSDKDGTWVQGSKEGSAMEQAIISGVVHDRSEAKITIVGVPDRVGEAARIFTAVAAEVNIDMIVQNVSAVQTSRTDISFTLPKPMDRLRWKRSTTG